MGNPVKLNTASHCTLLLDVSSAMLKQQCLLQQLDQSITYMVTSYTTTYKASQFIQVCHLTSTN